MMNTNKRVQLLPNMETCLLTWLDKSPKRSGDKRHTDSHPDLHHQLHHNHHHRHHHNITLILFKANYPCWLMLKTWFISCRVPIHWTIFTVAERTYPLVYPIRSCKPFSSLSWYILHKSQQWPERTWVRQLGAGGPVGPDWSPETRHQATNCFDFGFGLESLSWEEKTRSDDEHE